MARPRVFISSTFYDLKQIRADLEHFIREMGYDPVLHERGSVPYGSKEKLEQYCYREIHQVEILVSVIGGRFGSQSDHQPYSISQQELKTAYALGIPVFIFVDSAVLAEYRTYLRNKEVPGVTSTMWTTLESINFWRRFMAFRTTIQSRRLDLPRTLSVFCASNGQECFNASSKIKSVRRRFRSSGTCRLTCRP